MSVIESTCDSCGDSVGRGEYYCKDCRLEKKASPDSSPIGLKLLAAILGLNIFFHLVNILVVASAGLGNVGAGAGFLAVVAFLQIPFAYGMWTLKSWTYSGGLVILTVLLAVTFFTGLWLNTITLAFIIPYLVGKRRLFKY